MKWLFLISILFLFSHCTKERTSPRVDEIIDSLIAHVSMGGNVVGVLEQDKNDHYLYTIFNSPGAVYDEEGNILVSFVRKYLDKNIFYYSSVSQEKKMEATLIEKIIIDDKVPHGMLWYYAKCKTSSKELLVQAANDRIAPYEIPTIREFSCHSTNIKVNPIEMIANYATIGVNDSNRSVTIGIVAKVYKRNKNSLLTYKDLTTKGDFFFIKRTDKTKGKINELTYREAKIDDPLWKDDPELELRFALDIILQGKEFDEIRKHLVDCNAARNELKKSIYFIFYEKTKKKESSDENGMKRIECLIPDEVPVYLNIKGIDILLSI